MTDNELRHISYLSWRKVNELYDQIDKEGIVKRTVHREKGGDAKLGASGSFFSFLKGSAELGASAKHTETDEQKKTEISKFLDIVRYIESRNLICDLNSALEADPYRIPKSFCYKYVGRFSCTFQNLGMLSDKGEDKKLEVSEKERAAMLDASGETTDRRIWDTTCILNSGSDNISIILAASLRYFIRMGSGGGDPYPNSSNAFFFEGYFRPKFETIFFPVGSEGNTFYGTPLVLAYHHQDDVEIEI